jgi:hypothetical protein
MNRAPTQRRNDAPSSCYYSFMPVLTAALPTQRRNDATTPDACVREVNAKLVSINGGVVLALCILVTTVAIASALVQNGSGTQAVLFAMLAFASWVYLIDAVTEKMRLCGREIILSSAITSSKVLKLDGIRTITLRHEGLNANLGVESVTIKTIDGHSSRLPLGPCWRRRELEAFLDSISSLMGYGDIVDVEK